MIPVCAWYDQHGSALQASRVARVSCERNCWARCAADADCPKAKTASVKICRSGVQYSVLNTCPYHKVSTSSCHRQTFSLRVLPWRTYTHGPGDLRTLLVTCRHTCAGCDRPQLQTCARHRAEAGTAPGRDGCQPGEYCKGALQDSGSCTPCLCPGRPAHAASPLRTTPEVVCTVKRPDGSNWTSTSRDLGRDRRGHAGICMHRPCMYLSRSKDALLFKD